MYCKTVLSDGGFLKLTSFGSRMGLKTGFAYALGFLRGSDMHFGISKCHIVRMRIAAAPAVNQQQQLSAQGRDDRGGGMVDGTNSARGERWLRWALGGWQGYAKHSLSTTGVFDNCQSRVQPTVRPGVSVGEAAVV